MDLHNNHNVYVIGAGFSADENYPLLAGFLDTMRDSRPWLEKARRLQEVESLDNVFGFRLESSSAAYRLSIDLENIEDLFSLAAASTPSILKDISWSIAATIDFVRRHRPGSKWKVLCRQGAVQLPIASRKFVDPGNPGRDAFELSTHEIALLALTGALGDAEGSENTFISLNYDTLVEDACDSLGISYELGLPGVGPVAPAVLLQPIVGRVNLLKLHGSVTWSRVDDALCVHRSYEDVLNGASTPEIIPPTWGKTFGRELAQVWERASKALESATRVIFIGYSFPHTDIHMKFLLGAGLQRNVSLRGVYVVDPRAKELRQTILNLFRDDARLLHDKHFIQQRLTDAISNPVFLSAINRNVYPVLQGREEVRASQP